MSLIDDWRAGKLEDGDYYCKITESPETEIIYSGGMSEDLIVEILAKVPNYDHFVDLNKKVKELENKLAIATDTLVHLRGIFLSPDSIDSNYDFAVFLNRIDKVLLEIYRQKVEGQNDDIVEVIAPCDYKEVKRLNKILKNVLESNEALAVNINELSRKIEAYQLSEKEAQEIISELDYKNEQFRQLLKESIRLISYEHEVYEDENFIKGVNEVLK
nr:MAG TPA: hypothetical protein [Caudoviricetes sp.]